MSFVGIFKAGNDGAILVGMVMGVALDVDSEENV